MSTRGRKPLTEEQRAAGRQASKDKIRNITLDADLVQALNDVADKLGLTFGFRPTLSQTVKHLIHSITEAGI